jgi:hypothetical protein
MVWYGMVWRFSGQVERVSWCRHMRWGDSSCNRLTREGLCCVCNDPIVDQDILRDGVQILSNCVHGIHGGCIDSPEQQLYIYVGRSDSMLECQGVGTLNWRGGSVKRSTKSSQFLQTVSPQTVRSRRTDRSGCKCLLLQSPECLLMLLRFSFAAAQIGEGRLLDLLFDSANRLERHIMFRTSSHSNRCIVYCIGFISVSMEASKHREEYLSC